VRAALPLLEREGDAAAFSSITRYNHPVRVMPIPRLYSILVTSPVMRGTSTLQTRSRCMVKKNNW